MRHTILLILVFTLFYASGLGQKKKTDRDEAGLFGPVKSVQSKSVDYSDGVIKGEGFMKREGDVVTYDPGGREIDRMPVSDFGEAMGKMSRTFDKQGLLIESVWLDPKGSVIRKNAYTYVDGRLAEDLTYDGKGKLVEKTVKTYEPSGQLTRETYYDPIKPVARTEFKYDDKNLLVETAFFMADGRKATAPVGPCLGAHRVTYDYDERGQVIGRSVFEDSGALKKGFQYAYDERKNMTKYVADSASSTTRFVYTYEFDAKGNWTKQIATGTNLEKGLTVFGNKPTPYVRATVTTREILYY